MMSAKIRFFIGKAQKYGKKVCGNQNFCYLCIVKPLLKALVGGMLRETHIHKRRNCTLWF